MSIISELVSVLGADNVNAIVALVLAGLTGKTSWDFYKSKEVVKKRELKTHSDALSLDIEEIKKSIEEIHSSISEIRRENLSSKEFLDKSEDRLSNKIKNLEE